MEPDPYTGTLIADRYRVGRKLGEGGMGVVYLAVHEALHKQVALKILGTVRGNAAEAVARFEREAIATANVRHPNIAETMDFGRLPDGGLYLAMEYVEGTTLRQLLADHGKLPAARALGILRQVGAALTAAHARDVVHRDLKPDNVIVMEVRDSGRGRTSERVKVIDFGIAKLRSATFGAGGTGLTASGTVFGTPEYMAPEQVMGQAVDARADQYALGVLAFELLAGKPPFKAEDVGQLMMMHVGAPIPSSRDLTPELPPTVDAVLARMLAKLPDERFGSVEEAMEALEASLSAPAPPPVGVPAVSPNVVEAVAAPPTRGPLGGLETTLASPGSPPASRRWLPLAIVVGLVAFMLGAAVIALVARSSADPGTSEEPPAERQQTKTKEKPAEHGPPKGKGKDKRWR